MWYCLSLLAPSSEVSGPGCLSDADSPWVKLLGQITVHIFITALKTVKVCQPYRWGELGLFYRFIFEMILSLHILGDRSWWMYERNDIMWLSVIAGELHRWLRSPPVLCFLKTVNVIIEIKNIPTTSSCPSIYIYIYINIIHHLQLKLA